GGGDQFFLIVSSILKIPIGAPLKRRLKALGRQRRSSVLRRVRLRSAMENLRIGCRQLYRRRGQLSSRGTPSRSSAGTREPSAPTSSPLARASPSANVPSK